MRFVAPSYRKLSAALLLPLVSSLLFITPALADSQPPSLVSVSQAYRAHDYNHAMTQVTQMLTKNDSSADLHYMKANILVAQGQNAAAVDEYRRTLSRNPSPAIAQYCQMMLSRLSSTGTAQAAIQSQVALQANAIQATAVNASNTMVNDGAQFQAWNDRQTRQTVNAMQNSGSYLADGTWAPMYSAADIQNVQQRGAMRSQRAIARANMSSTNLTADAQNKIAQTADSAQSLQFLLDEPVANGIPHLQALGTNLYVRNYADSSPAPTPQAAKAQGGQFPSPLNVAPEALLVNNNGKGATGNNHQATAAVTGTVMRK